MSELSRRGLILELPARSCAVGDRLAIAILPFQWDVQARVIEAKTVAPDGTLRASLEIELSAREPWRHFRARLRLMQAHIDRLFKRMRA